MLPTLRAWRSGTKLDPHSRRAGGDSRFARSGRDLGETHHRSVFLGEFGTLEDAPLASRVRWTEFVVREAEARGFSWAYWEFCSGFGAYDAKTDAWRKGLKAALLK